MKRARELVCSRPRPESDRGSARAPPDPDARLTFGFGARTVGGPYTETTLWQSYKIVIDEHVYTYLSWERSGRYTSPRRCRTVLRVGVRGAGAA